MGYGQNLVSIRLAVKSSPNLIIITSVRHKGTEAEGTEFFINTAGLVRASTIPTICSIASVLNFVPLCLMP